MRLTSTTGQRRHRVTVQIPNGAPVPDGDGGFRQEYSNASPAVWYTRIQVATARDLERITSGTVLSTATHIVSGAYHAGVSITGRLVFGTRLFNITGVANPEERNVETVAVCVELIGAEPYVFPWTQPHWIQAGWMQ